MIRHQGNQRAGGEAAVHHQLSAVQKQRRRTSRQQHAWNGARKKVRDLHFEQRIHKPVVAGPEPFGLARLRSARDDQADAEQRLEQEAADLGARFPDRADPRGKLRLKPP